MAIYLMKDKVKGDEERFSQAEFDAARRILSDYPKFSTKDQQDYWGPEREYIALIPTRKIVQLQEVENPLLKELIAALHPKYVKDGFKGVKSISDFGN